MILITIDPIVLQTLEKHYPNSNAKKVLNKYIKLLTDQISHSCAMGRDTWQVSKGLYSMSLYKQANKGGQIGEKKIRLHKWLELNNLELVKKVIVGSNLSKLLSVVKPTHLITITEITTQYVSVNEDITEELQTILNDENKSNLDLFNYLYPELTDSTDTAAFELFDKVDVDIRSLTYYLVWLENEARYLSKSQFAQYKYQADTILRIAKHTNGVFYQRKKDSPFGRHYYSGISVQSVNKELRKAMLGNSWEYDIRACAFAWKMGFARECHEALNLTEPLSKVFQETILYLEHRDEFMGLIKSATFHHDTDVKREDQSKLIKRAVTAIGFGARLNRHAWRTKNGNDWERTAIYDIIRNKEECERFINCTVMRKFVHEQNLLDDFLYDFMKANDAVILKDPQVQTQSGRVSKAKVIAYLFQHGETQVMDIVEAEMKRLGRTVMARIHDAIIVKQRLGVDNKSEIEFKMREMTDNQYWKLTAKMIEAYNRPMCLDKAEIQAHRERIRKEEAHAKSMAEHGLLIRALE